MLSRFPRTFALAAGAAVLLALAACASPTSSRSPSTPGTPQATEPAVTPSVTVTASVTATAGRSPSAPPTASVAATDTAWEARYMGVLVRGFKTSKKLVALTLDDGPNGSAAAVAKALRSYDASATFFSTKWAVYRFPAAIQMLTQVGEIGDHTFDHKPLTGSLAYDLGEIEHLDRIVKPLIGHDTTWVRPYGGEVNALGLKAAEQSGHIVVDWDIDSYDSHQAYIPPEKVYENVITKIHPGCIVLMHFSHKESIEALPMICAWLQEHGYRMVTLTELAREASGPE